MGVSKQEAEAIKKYLYPNADRKSNEGREIVLPILVRNPAALEFYFKVAIHYFLKCTNWKCCGASFGLMFDILQDSGVGGLPKYSHEYLNPRRDLKEAVKIKIKQLGFETGGNDLRYILDVIGIHTQRPVKRIEYVEVGRWPFKKTVPRELIDYEPREKEEILRELG